MQITVKGTNLEVSGQIRDEAVAKLSKVSRLFDRVIEMDVVFSEDRNPRIPDRVHCEVTAHLKGTYLRASAAAPDPLSAIDRAESKLARQVRKHKTKVVSRSRRQARDPAAEAATAAAMPASAADLVTTTE